MAYPNTNDFSGSIARLNSSGTYEPVVSYIYFYHTDEYFILPEYPEQVSDHMQSQFAQQNALARTAPVMSYSSSGPRSVQFSIKFHRDLMNQINTQGSNVHIDSDEGIITSVTDDYIDLLVKKLQSLSVPKFDATQKMVQPPRVAVRFGNEIFVKGVVQGGVGVDYMLPLLANGKYAQAAISFNIIEVVPYDAETIGKLGSFRGLTSGLRAHLAELSNKQSWGI